MDEFIERHSKPPFSLGAEYCGACSPNHMHRVHFALGRHPVGQHSFKEQLSQQQVPPTNGPPQSTGDCGTIHSRPPPGPFAPI